MRPLLETEKNFLKCAILMIIVGITLFILGENNLGVGIIVIGVVFLGCAGFSLIKNKDGDDGARK